METLRARLAQNPELATRWATELPVNRSRGAGGTIEGRCAGRFGHWGYRRFTDVDANAFVVGASISMPLFDKTAPAFKRHRESTGQGP
ncbi:MAG: hypothetical protein U0Q12_10285 [Vicinamibacterales bacterium]